MLRPVACTLAALALGACVDDATLPGTEAPEPGRLDVVSDTVDFGAHEVGDVAAANVVVQSVGGETAAITGVGLINAPDVAVVEGGAVALAPGEVAEIRLRFAPTTDHTLDGRLVLQSDVAPGERIVFLTGDGLGPRARVEPEFVDLGEVFTECTEAADVTIANDGRAALVVASIEYWTASQHDEFALEGDGPEAFVLDPGETETLRVLYTPIDLLADYGELTVTTNDPDLPVTDATQAGTGVRPEVHVDSWTWTSAPIDLVFSVPPNPATIAVTIDGAPTSGWTYDEVAGALLLDPAPAPGAVVEASYEAAADACDPI